MSIHNHLYEYGYDTHLEINKKGKKNTSELIKHETKC